jgi:hypothetical protein
MNEAINTELLEKELAKIEGKILRKSKDIKSTPGMSPFMHEKRQRLLKELKVLQLEKIEILKKFDGMH